LGTTDTTIAQGEQDGCSLCTELHVGIAEVAKDRPSAKLYTIEEKDTLLSSIGIQILLVEVVKVVGIRKFIIFKNPSTPSLASST
jgi:hypothetical protein